MNIIKKIYQLWLSRKNRAKIMKDPVTRSQPSSILNKINIKINKNENELEIFQKRSLDMILEHMNHSEYSEHRTLIREINFLTHYTFEVLKDDFYKGDSVLGKSITKLDDYVFSQYRKDPALANNIKKLITVAFSNRFDSRPHDNLLAYYVFLEESGFEITMLLSDFYLLLQNKNNKKKIKGNNYITNIEVENKIISNQTRLTSEEESDQTLMPQALSEMVSPLGAQKKIIEEFVKLEKQNLLKKDNKFKIEND